MKPALWGDLSTEFNCASISCARISGISTHQSLVCCVSRRDMIDLGFIRNGDALGFEELLGFAPVSFGEVPGAIVVSKVARFIGRSGWSKLLHAFGVRPTGFVRTT